MGGPLTRDRDGSIIVPTAVQISSDTLSYWTSMTCLYDPMWVTEPDRVTLPIAMFHITSMKETGQTQVSKKRVILYEPQADNTVAEQANVVRPSVLRSIVDNIVRDPKTYSINAIVPYQPLGRYVADGVEILVNTISYFMTLVGKSDLSDQLFSRYLSTAASLADTMNTVVSTLDMLPSMNDVSRINKNSLDVMWERSHFLCMKMWTGYDYKFVAITNIEMEKVPREDDVYRMVMQVQEMPVLVTNLPKNAKVSSGVNGLKARIISTTQQALSESLAVVNGIPDNAKVKF